MDLGLRQEEGIKEIFWGSHLCPGCVHRCVWAPMTLLGDVSSLLCLSFLGSSREHCGAPLHSGDCSQVLVAIGSVPGLGATALSSALFVTDGPQERWGLAGKEPGDAFQCDYL